MRQSPKSSWGLSPSLWCGRSVCFGKHVAVPDTYRHKYACVCIYNCIDLANSASQALPEGSMSRKKKNEIAFLFWPSTFHFNFPRVATTPRCSVLWIQRYKNFCETQKLCRSAQFKETDFSTIDTVTGISNIPITCVFSFSIMVKTMQSNQNQ